jgi:hypothetical protein
VGGLGVCGLDPRRPTLRATEIRPCWTAAAVPEVGAGESGDVARAADHHAAAGARATVAGPSTSRTARTFIPVDELAPREAPRARPAADPGIGPATSRTADRWSLWAELER